MQTIVLSKGWIVRLLVDEDKHLNIWIENRHSPPYPPAEIDTGQNGSYDLVYRFTTPKIEKESET